MPKKIKRYPELTAIKGRIREKGTSYRELARNINISLNTLSDKINGFYAMELSEAEKIAEYLDIHPLEMTKYFFPKMMSNAKNSA